MTQSKSEQTPNWALEAIRKARNEQWTWLDLRGNQDKQLVVFPKEIIQLKNLQMLFLSDNKLTTIPNNINKLIDLEVLDLGGNPLVNMPQAVTRLDNLKELRLYSNQLTTLPTSIARLSKLQKLLLSGNKLTTIPDVITRLTTLQKLSLNFNEITNVPETITQLAQLKSLDLSGNRLKVIPSWLIELPKLEELYLHGNSIDQPPPEVLKLKMLKSVDLESLRLYFRQQKEAGEEALFEAKLLIVGEPGAGKTSLARKLINPAIPLLFTKDESTKGIDVHTWTFPVPDNIQGGLNAHASDFQVNIWDFGGQEIYHATHQFFLSRRSLYVVVADAREQKTNFFHWLDLIEHLSDRSPVLIFNNAFQNRHWAVNEQQLEAHFPDTFKKPFAFNLAEDKPGLAYLRQKIQEEITQLPHVGDILPRTWVNVRRALENNTQATVTQQEFLQLCNENGFTRIDDALQLSSYFHDLGVILHFQDDPLLKHTVILKPEWGTLAVYRVLDNKTVKANFGFFSRSDLGHIWYESEYVLLHDELLALMMKFQLCYAIPGQKERYIAPQLLSEQPPKYELIQGSASAQKSLQLRYKYESFMPKGLLTRFIVGMHPHIATDSNHQLVWRTGVVLEKDEARAEVVEFYHRREIRIRVTGKNMRDLLTIISYQLDELHRPFHRLKFDKLIPCNCATCRKIGEPHFYKLDTLKTRLEHGKATIECDKPPFNTVHIRPLLDDIGAAIQKGELSFLLRTFNLTFNTEDLRTLCFELGINYDNLPAEALEGKQRELLLLLERNGRILELINLLRQKRPNFNW